MGEILIGTSNKGKYNEILEVIGDLDMFKFISLDKFHFNSQPKESGSTYRENARIKAMHYFQATSVPTFAEDSGIEVDALESELGIHTRRWGAGEKATDQEWIDFFLNRMKDVENRKAKFVCHGCFFDGKKEYYFDGECEGTITDRLMNEVKEGIPLSSCFIPSGFDKVYSSLSMAEKNMISHRGRAVHQFKNFLLSIYNPN